MARRPSTHQGPHWPHARPCPGLPESRRVAVLSAAEPPSAGFRGRLEGAAGVGLPPVAQGARRTLPLLCGANLPAALRGHVEGDIPETPLFTRTRRHARPHGAFPGADTAWSPGRRWLPPGSRSISLVPASLRISRVTHRAGPCSPKAGRLSWDLLLRAPRDCPHASASSGAPALRPCVQARCPHASSRGRLPPPCSAPWRPPLRRRV